MKCLEVVEWMHRYVDHDLDEEESDLLFEHLRHCEDCTEKFELLIELSTQLEELPLVAPNFSLVDAILPKLEAIDRTRQEEGTTAEIISPVAPVALEPKQNHRVQRNNNSQRGRFYRVGALGTVAAAAILGLFIYQYEPQSIPNAEIAYNSLESSSNSKMDKSNSAAQSSVSDGEVADEATMDKKISQDTANSTGSDKNLADSNNAADGTTNQAPTSTESPAIGDKMTSANSGEKSGPSTSQKPSSSANPNAAKPASPKQSEAPVSDGIPSAKDALNPYGLMETSVGDEQDGMTSRMGIMENGFMLNYWNSPDGTYTVELKDGHLFFYKIASETERLLVVDQTIDGNWVSGEWSQDSTTFNYQTEQNGATTSYTVDPVKDNNIQTTSP